MGVAAAVWCLTCRVTPDIVLSFERRGVMLHHGACRTHVHVVADRVVAEMERIDAELRAEAVSRYPADLQRRAQVAMDQVKESGDG